MPTAKRKRRRKAIRQNKKNLQKAEVPVIASKKQVDEGQLTDADKVISVGDVTGLSVISQRRVPFTSELAQRVLEAEEFAADRKLDNGHVDVLLTAMRRRTFLPEQAQLVTCEFDGKVYRMNGQHTSWSRVMLSDPGYEPLITVIKYHADTIDDLRRLYASIDRGKARTKTNVIHSHLLGSEEFPDFNRSILRMLASGLNAFKNGFKSNTGDDPDTLAHLLKTDYYDLAIKVGNFIKSHQKQTDHKHIRRSPVWAALFATYKKCERDSARFWHDVAEGEMLTNDDPAMVLRKKLMTSAVNAGRGGASFKNNVPADDMYCWCIDAWNAHRSGRKFKGSLRGFSGRSKLPGAK